MRRELVSAGAEHLRYEIREIVAFANALEPFGVRVMWENIGDPVAKGEPIAPWIKEIVGELAADDASYRYVDTQGFPGTREFLAGTATARGGAALSPDDIIFFNGLGDAVSKVFGFLKRESRVLGPSPAYSTFSSAEGAHSGYEHLTYRLDPDRRWLPDMEDIRLKVKYNDSVAGLLLINPDNPTGVVYPRGVLEEFVDIAREHGLFIVCDETYAHVVYNGARTLHMSEVIGDVPGMSLRSISKEYPWPGARCGWAEVFNKDSDPEFALYIKSLVDAKRLEVCSTALPQRSIPRVFPDPRYRTHLDARNARFALRAKEAFDRFSGVPGCKVSLPQGALYFTVLLDPEAIARRDCPSTGNSELDRFLAGASKGQPADKRFVYWLLAAKGICVVPLTGFYSELPGFRITLLEHDDAKRRAMLDSVAQAIGEYAGK